MDLANDKQYRERFRCNGCDTLLEVIYEGSNSIGTGLFTNPLNSVSKVPWTKLRYTCPVEKEKETFVLDLNKNKYRFSRIEILAIKNVEPEKS